MNILLCPDKFKGSLSSSQICELISKVVTEQITNVNCISHPMADGGDGSVAVLDRFLELEKVEVLSCDPIMRPIGGHYFIKESNAYIEVATCSGLALLNKNERNPMVTSTYGTGVLMQDAMKRGCKNIYLFLGGSATHDCGIGIMAALGYEWLDINHTKLDPIGQNLSKIAFMKHAVHNVGANITLLCDVKNPLIGAKGAAMTFASQKGADFNMVRQLEESTLHFLKFLNTETSISPYIEGIGSAGGIGLTLISLCGAGIKNGFEILSTITGLEASIRNADVVISGEGCLDMQSLDGKLVGGLASICLQYQKPLLLIVGSNQLHLSFYHPVGITEVFALSSIALDQDDSISNAAKHISDLTKDQLCKWIIERIRTQ